MKTGIHSPYLPPSAELPPEPALKNLGYRSICREDDLARIKLSRQLFDVRIVLLYRWFLIGVAFFAFG